MVTFTDAKMQHLVFFLLKCCILASAAILFYFGNQPFTMNIPLYECYTMNEPIIYERNAESSGLVYNQTVSLLIHHYNKYFGLRMIHKL